MPTKRILSYGDTGPLVKTAQRLLAGTGTRFRRFYKGPIDGEFGPRTGSACVQAKLILGYRARDVKPSCGQPLMEYLSGKRKLTPAMLVRRHARLAAERLRQREQSKVAKMRRTALAAIKAELGTMERPSGSNVIKYNTWWGWGAVAYCVIGVSWVWVVKVGSKAFKRGVRWANTDAMLADAKAGRNGLRVTDDPKPGCPGVIDFDGHADPDHAITYAGDNGDGTCTTYEFNATSDKTGLQGVVVKRRPLRNCWFFDVVK